MVMLMGRTTVPVSRHTLKRRRHRVGHTYLYDHASDTRLNGIHTAAFRWLAILYRLRSESIGVMILCLI